GSAALWWVWAVMGIASLAKLIDSLPSPGVIANADELRRNLLIYQAFQKPLFDRVIAQNHEAALAMESTAEADVVETIRRQNKQCQKIHQLSELRKQHLLEAGGYPFGVPLSAWVGLPLKSSPHDLDLQA
ncbi:MAG TPA: hypothetical protein PKC13_30980, partial [Blastocatellia bacterium]|nr:hypothetical protein [Blastocatellia bacterium]